MPTALYLLNILLIISVSIYTILILFHIISWLSIKLPVKQQGPFKTSVSIIIAARNEEKNIASCIQSVLAQDYPAALLEIVVCNDHSEDKTKETAENALKGVVISKCISLSDNLTGKKRALELSIKESAGELIIITDADCTVEKGWISSIVRLYESSDYKMICGPVTTANEKSFCEKFQGLEVPGLSILSGAGINAGIPLMCNGANLTYNRKAFEDVGGFSGIDSIPTGDDTLLLFKMNKHFPGKIGFVKSKDAIVYTPAQSSWKSFLQQRIRWASKGLQSKNSLNSFVSLLVFITNFLLLIYPLSLFIYNNGLFVWLGCLGAKLVVDFLLLNCATVFFGKRSLLLLFPVGEIITVFYTSIIGLVANYSSYQWKGRKY
ncbi:MAG TPA: glycosyltransferase [Bacteroidia bacterium]|jgi:cellulose synthase/poly-beta-1,6-N-acetylglucosamine synthase-like glycosyltransferase|nr:glycosyltransferase [Bacteroidia bacterium]